jgi:hypothetical protein
MVSFAGVIALAGCVLLIVAGRREAASPASRIAEGLICVPLGLMALATFSITWPLDWVKAGPVISATFRASEYDLRYLQYPGGDFYSDRLEVASGGARRAHIYLNVDNYKCWYGAIARAGDQVTFTCLPFGGRSAISIEWLEAQLQGCPQSECNLSDNYYEWMGLRH